MQLFKRILREPAAETPRVERRSAQRFALNPEFPLRAVLSFIGRDDTGALMGSSRQGWNWKGRLIECSENGARMQMGPKVKAITGDSCDLLLFVEDFELTIPCHIANIRERDEGMVYGLKYDIEDEATKRGYRQLLEVVALGSTLKLLSKTTKPDESGYLLEHYVSNRPARLTIWRHPANESVAAFEFQLLNTLVRAAVGYNIKYLASPGARPVTARKALEIQRLFRWVLPNLAPVVPEDVREFLRDSST